MTPSERLDEKLDIILLRDIAKLQMRLSKCEPYRNKLKQLCFAYERKRILEKIISHWYYSRERKVVDLIDIEEVLEEK